MESHRMLKMLVAAEGTSISDVLIRLSEKLDKKYPRNSFSTRLKNGTVNYEEMYAIAEILGYDIEFVKKDGNRRVIK